MQRIYCRKRKFFSRSHHVGLWGSGLITVHTFNLCSTWSFTLCQLYPPGNYLHYTLRRKFGGIRSRLDAAGDRNIKQSAPCNACMCRYRWPHGLRRGSAATRLLGLWVRIPPRTLMSVSCECCVLSGRVLCVGLDIRPEESHQGWCV